MTDISYCRWDTTVLSEKTKNCCPKPEICLNNNSEFCCKNCNFVQIAGPPLTKRNVIQCIRPTRFSTPYYYKQNNKNNCCHGQFKLFNSEPDIKYNKLNNFLLLNKSARDSKNFGDISYPRVQRGRWNYNYTNTKMYPVTSIKAVLDSKGKTIGYTTATQSNNLFKNTHHNMSKKKLFSYLAKNRIYLKR